MNAEIPTREEIVKRVSDLIPTLRSKATWAEENRRLHDETIEALAEAGVFKLRTPRRYGGYEADTRTLVEVGTELGRADGSIAWTAGVYWIPTWMACLFPDQVQDEIFATPDVRICGTLSPSGVATPAEGGVIVNGSWSFITGAWHAHWQEIITVQIMPNGEPMPLMALVPMSDLTIVDDWYTSGLSGTGSVTTVAQDLFVPQERVLPLGAILTGQSASEINRNSPIYRLPLLPVASASSVGTALGLARGAQDVFQERLPQRSITYTSYQSQGEAPITHLKVAEAATAADEAEFHAHRLANLVDAKGTAGADWTMAERVRARADLGAACRRAREAVDVLALASGATSLQHDVPIQRIARDIRAITLHALMNPDTNAELYGRVLCGLEPNSQYV